MICLQEEVRPGITQPTFKGLAKNHFWHFLSDNPDEEEVRCSEVGHSPCPFSVSDVHANQVFSFYISRLCPKYHFGLIPTGSAVARCPIGFEAASTIKSRFHLVWCFGRKVHTHQREYITLFLA